MIDKVEEETVKQLFENLDNDSLGFEELVDAGEIQNAAGFGDDTFDVLSGAAERDDSVLGFDSELDDENLPSAFKQDGEPAFDFLSQEYDYLDYEGEQDQPFGDFAGIDEFRVDGLPAASADVDISDPGVNWGAIFWLVVLLVSAGTLAYNEYDETNSSKIRASLMAATLELDSDIGNIRHEALMASNGMTESFAMINSLSSKIDS